MAEWIKWWKNKFAVIIMLIAVLAVVIAFLFAYFFSWGWIVSIIIAASAGITMRILITNKINNWINSK